MSCRLSANALPVRSVTVKWRTKSIGLQTALYTLALFWSDLLNGTIVRLLCPSTLINILFVVDWDISFPYLHYGVMSSRFHHHLIYTRISNVWLFVITSPSLLARTPLHRVIQNWYCLTHSSLTDCVDELCNRLYLITFASYLTISDKQIVNNDTYHRIVKLM